VGREEGVGINRGGQENKEKDHKINNKLNSEPMSF
jgi:hypothetical protein